MPRIKKSKHPVLPTVFTRIGASTELPPNCEFKIGDYVEDILTGGWFGWVCGCEHYCGHTDIIAYNPDNEELGQNGKGTRTSSFWRKVCQE